MNSKALRRTFYEGNRVNYGAAIFLQVLSAALIVSLSWILGAVMDAVALADVAALRRTAILMAVLLPLFLLVEGSSVRIRARFVHKGLRQYKEQAFRALSGKSIQAFTAENTGSYLSALTNDAASIEENYLHRAVMLVYQALQFALALGMMLWYSPVMTLAVVLLSLLPMAVSLLMGGGLARREGLVSDQNAAFTARIKDLLGGYAVLKSFRAEDRARALFDRENAALETAKEQRRWYAGLVSVIAGAAGLVVQLGVFLIGAVLALRGSISLGTVLIFVNLCNSLIEPIRVVPEYLASRKAAKALIGKLAQLVREDAVPNGAQKEAVFADRIALRGLRFGYEPEAPVLRDLNLTLEKGRSYAVVGASGSGKSTLLQLLMGTYRGYEGSLTLDGTELKELSPDSLYAMAGLISQNVFLFDDTIRNNITLFAPFPNEQVERAIRLSGLEPVIRARGEDYRCGENGSRLSGGERQRIAIARSLLKGSQLLLVDEATSALDNETAQHVSDAILGLRDLTRVVVTHRLDAATLARYDRILMLKNGVLCEAGRFEELMEKKGQFYSLYTVSNG